MRPRGPLPRAFAAGAVNDLNARWQGSFALVLSTRLRVKYCGAMTLQPDAQASAEVSTRDEMTPATEPSFARRIFGRSLMDMAILLLITVILTGLRQPEGLLNDPDLWWHIACGRIVDQTHHFIHMEPFSFTVAGKPWIDPEWLSGMLFWLGYKSFGLIGIYLCSAVGICGNMLFLYLRSSWRSRNESVALWTSVLGLMLLTPNASARTILFGYLALSAVMAILEASERGKHRLLWLLPPVFCIWINLHGSWIFGIAILALHILCGWFRVDRGSFRQEALSWPERKQLLIVLGLCVVFLFINPYGWRLLWNPFDMAFGQTLNLGSVQEWEPLNLAWIVGKVSVLTIGLMVLANVLHARKWKLFEMVLFFAAWYEAFAHARFTVLAALLTLPMLATDLTRSFFPPPAIKKTIPLMNGLIAVGVLVVLTRFLPTEAKLQKGLAKEMPMQTIESLQPGWRTLNQEDFGGLMDFYSKPTFIDTRWDTFEHHGVMKDFVDIVHLHDSLRLLDQYRIDHVLIEEDQPLAYLLERTPGWSIARKEGDGQNLCVLFARPAAPTSVPSH